MVPVCAIEFQIYKSKIKVTKILSVNLTLHEKSAHLIKNLMVKYKTARRLQEYRKKNQWHRMNKKACRNYTKILIYKRKI